MKRLLVIIVVFGGLGWFSVYAWQKVENRHMLKLDQKIDQKESRIQELKGENAELEQQIKAIKAVFPDQITTTQPDEGE